MFTADDPELEAVAAGVTGALAAVDAIAEGDEPRALLALNELDRVEIGYAAAYLLACLRESVLSRVGGDMRRLELALKAGVRGGAEEDVLMGQAAVIVHREEERNG